MRETPLNFDRDDDKTIVTFDIETERAVLKHFHKLYSGLELLISRYQKKELEEGFKGTLLKCSEHSMKSISDAFGFEGILKKQQEELSRDIRQRNEDNRALRKQLGEKVSNEDLREKMKNISNNFKKWWNIEGLGHSSSIRFTEYGSLELELSGMITHNYYEEGRNLEEKIKKLITLGFKLDSTEKDWVNDCDHNRALIKKLLKDKFPSASIGEYRCYDGQSNKPSKIRSFTVSIYNLDELDSSGPKTE